MNFLSMSSEENVSATIHYVFYPDDDKKKNPAENAGHCHSSQHYKNKLFEHFKEFVCVYILLITGHLTSNLPTSFLSSHELV